MTTTEQIREALEYAKREAQESGKHFSQSEVDRLNAKEYVRIVDRALALLRSMDGQEPVAWTDPLTTIVVGRIGHECNPDRFTTPLYLHPPPQTGEPRLTGAGGYTEVEIEAAIERLGIAGSDMAHDLMYNIRNPKP